jgi:hypothetical protein
VTIIATGRRIGGRYLIRYVRQGGHVTIAVPAALWRRRRNAARKETTNVNAA